MVLNYISIVILKNKVIDSHPPMNPSSCQKKKWSNHNRVLDLLSMDHFENEMKTILFQSAENLFSPLTDPQLGVNLEAEDTSLYISRVLCHFNSKGIKNDYKHPLHSRKVYTLSKRKAKFPFQNNHRGPFFIFRTSLWNLPLNPLLQQKQSIKTDLASSL